jgi:hypothetical protein
MSRASARRIMHLFTTPELSELYGGVTGTQLPKDLSRENLLSRLEDDIVSGPSDMLQSATVLFAKKLEQISIDQLEALGRLEKKDLLSQCHVFGVSRVDERNTKDEIVRALLDRVSLTELFGVGETHRKRESKKRIQAGLQSKAIYSLEKMAATLDEVRETTYELEQLGHILSALEGLTQQVKDLNSASRYPTEPDTLSYLNAFRDVLGRLEGRDDPLSFAGILDKVALRLNIDRKTACLKALEIAALTSVFRALGDLSWRPTMDQFTRTLREEFERAKAVDGLAEIPSLRSAVSHRLVMKERDFDEMLVQAWRTGLVKLEPGAPIGRSEVDYLKTDDGRKFFYLKIGE